VLTGLDFIDVFNFDLKTLCSKVYKAFCKASNTSNNNQIKNGTNFGTRGDRIPEGNYRYQRNNGSCQCNVKPPLCFYE
jgi:hypothetical protein